MSVVSSARIGRLAAFALSALLVACGGGSADAPPPPESGGTTPPPVTGVAPTITEQPANATIQVGATATFTVAATGTAPISYQWQRNGAAIAGATGTSYTTPAAVVGDSGAAFRAVATNAYGSATSNAATLTVNVVNTPPVLTIAPQPASTNVTAGATASFTVGGSCSSGTLTIQWQRSNGGAFTDIAGATATTYSFMAAAGDTGAQFRANLSCSGQSAATSSVATLTVAAPGVITLSSATVTGIAAQTFYGSATAIDQAADGSYYFTAPSSVWHLAADLSSITLFAGDVFITGATDGTGTAARFTSLAGITHDASGNLWVTDADLIRRITPAGAVATIAGGSDGFADGTGTAAKFTGPRGLAFGADGDLYIADLFNGRVRRMTVGGVVTTYASGFNAVFGIAVGPTNIVYASDPGNNRVMRIPRNGNDAGTPELLAGSGTLVATDPADGPGATAQIPAANAVVLRGNLLFVRDYAGLIRSIDVTTGVVATVAGSPALGGGYADGASGQAQFSSSVGGLTAGSGGGFVVSDVQALRSVDAAGNVTTFAYGAPSGTTSIPPTETSTGVLAQQPFDFLRLNLTTLAVDSQGRIVVGEENEHTIRRIDTAGHVSLLAGLVMSAGSVDGAGSAAQLAGPGALTIAPSGLVYFGAAYALKRLDPGTNLVTTIAGSTAALGSGTANGPPGTGQFGSLDGIAVAANGDVIVSDGNNTAIRRVDATGTLSTFSGVIGQGGTTDGPAATARYYAPGQLLDAPDGTMLLNDNGKLRRIAADGSVATIPGVTGVTSMVIDPAGVIYVLRADGLSSVSTTGATTLLVPLGSGLVLGNVGPTLGTTDGSMAMLSAKQIVVVASRSLVVVTLP